MEIFGCLGLCLFALYRYLSSGFDFPPRLCCDTEEAESYATPARSPFVGFRCDLGNCTSGMFPSYHWFGLYHRLSYHRKSSKHHRAFDWLLLSWWNQDSSEQNLGFVGSHSQSPWSPPHRVVLSLRTRHKYAVMLRTQHGLNMLEYCWIDIHRCLSGT